MKKVIIIINLGTLLTVSVCLLWLRLTKLLKKVLATVTGTKSSSQRNDFQSYPAAYPAATDMQFFNLPPVYIPYKHFSYYWAQPDTWNWN
jgi:hypothetical protein